MRDVETTQHMFLFCPVFAPMWGLIWSWVGIFSADLLSIHDHFVQFSSLMGALKLVAPSCSYFGYVAFAWYGMNVIAEFLKPRNRRSSKC
jgi:hypothetical protein